MAKSQFVFNNDSNPQPLITNNANKTPSDQPDSNMNTYGAKANDIVVIADPSPVIILFGAASSGKTMTLIRLTKYLIQQGYQVLPERTFRDARDEHYQDMCNNFISIVNDTKASARNQIIDFMLVKVMDASGRTICQILEAPGEHYFDPTAPNKQFPTYINTISQSNNRRTWVFIVEKDWMNQSDRNNFAQKITDLQQQYVLTQDKVIFTCHKADLHRQYMSGGHYNVPLFFNDITNQYPNIFSRYVNTNPITKFWQKYNFEFVVFSSGTFKDDGEGRENYVPSNPSNPDLLWKSILKTVKGGWL
jgi:GTPase SAR1 family protein